MMPAVLSFRGHLFKVARLKWISAGIQHRTPRRDCGASLGFHSGYLQTDLILSASIFVPRMDDPMISYSETILPNTSPRPDSHGKNCAPKLPVSMNRMSIWCQDSGRT